jgi:solute carrier family 8 (sodium/calcium exchanger)
MVFEKDEDLKHIDIEIIDDNEWEPDEIFFVKLAIDPTNPDAKNVVLGKKAIQEITIINDDGKHIILHDLRCISVIF